MAYLLVLSGLVALFALPGTMLYRIYFSPLSNIPGPFWAQCSVLWKLWHLWNDTYNLAIRRAHESYGPFVRITYNEVSVCSEDALKKVLAPLYDKSPWYKIFAMPDTSFPNQMSETKAAKYSDIRKKVVPGYSLKATLKHESRIDEFIGLFSEMIDKFTSDIGKTPLSNFLTFLTYDLVGVVTFTSDLGFVKQQRDIDGIVANSDKLVKYLAVFGFFPAVHDYFTWYLGPVLAWLNMEPMKHVVRVTEDRLDRYRRDLETYHEKRSCDMLSTWRKQQNATALTEREVFAACLTNIAAGGETLSSFAQAFVWYILRNAEAKAKLDVELKDARAAETLSSPIQYSETLKLPYFQACLKETSRVHPINITGLARVAPTQGVQIGTQFFPGGTLLNVNQWALHYNKNIFGEDAYDYKPERWLKSNTHALEK